MSSNANKNIIYSIVLLLLVAIVYFYRQSTTNPSQDQNQPGSLKVVFSGNTMGTSYRVVYLDESGRDFQASVDSLLLVFNQSLSTYIPDSEIGRFNNGDSLVFDSPYFYPVLKSSQEIFELTEGAFDPTVGPLVNLWGFGPGGPQLKDSVNIDQLVKLIGFNNISFDETSIKKKLPGIKLDFSANAKGYGVDVIADFLYSKGIANYLVEIGGELVARGVNENGEIWKVGVTRPEELGNADQLYSIIALDNKAMATSGNYRNYYEVDGQKISHTINPATGRPVKHGLLSATVVAADCMTADALATAMMVMGTDKAIELQKKQGDFEIFLIFNDGEGNMKSFASEGLKPYLSFPVE
ncbi:FAD:protein FMN transferase [Cecembia rubra]|uniref:FAD:protein FMN transferase n=1 Tax=Cecembia rubra TaxID=1485585 RepID=A0A2P8E4C9_9BACT|nr:FAD:protein FMN transferase [Cecembia rubra]PSL04324.1 thiamine biosynthesis lipoprotein [Cecembia rubra]